MFPRYTPKTRALVRLSLLLACALAVCAFPTLRANFSRAHAAGRAGQDKIEDIQVPIISPGSAYRRTHLISDIPGFAPVLDPLLVNPWGLTATSSSPFWVANNGTSTTQLIRGDVGGSPVVLNPSPQTVNIPGGLPTGTVANTTTSFVLPGACASAPCTARFLFASITGNITGWNPNAPSAGSTTAVIAASHPGHVYTGLAIAANSGNNFLYAADFANGTIDVYGGTFTLQPAASFPFADPTIPNTSGNVYHPFNIQAIGGSLYVTYAKVGTDGKSENGPGFGYVRRFNTAGVRDLTFGINNGALDAPWGVAVAPASFGIFGGALLVGNFSDAGRINAFNPTTGAFLGALQDESGTPIEIDELWALQFGNGGNGGDPNTLYFTAGFAEEEHGLFGSLKPTTAQATSLVEFATTNFSVDEAAGHVDFTVVRTGDTSGTATVNYDTYDESQAGHASQKSDYEISLGTLTFNPGETSKTFRVLIVDDNYAEGDETISLALSNPTGAGVGLGSPNTAEITILDNDATTPSTNPLDTPSFFVRQQYLDMYNREPDGNQAAFVNQIAACGSNQACKNREMLAVATAFFTSNDYLGNGSLVFRTYRAAFGPNAVGGAAPVLYGNFELDLQAIQKDAAVGAAGASQLEANKVAYFRSFVTRPQFVAQYPTTQTPAQFVDALYLNAGVTPSTAERNAAIAEFGAASDTSDLDARGRALRRVAENAAFSAAQANAAFVALEYFGYLRRDPDTAGFNFWLNKLNSFGGNFTRAGMIRAFISSSEYGQRFGPSGILSGNAAPDAIDDTATTSANTPVTIDVLANDIDYDGQSVSLVSVTPGTGGTPTISSGMVNFTPAPNFVGTATFTYTITDGTDTDTATVTVNVTSAGVIQFSASAYTVAESAGTATVTVTRTGGSTGAVTVNYATSDGTATAGSDYTATSGTLSFATGETSKTFSVPIINDSIHEADETVNLTLSGATGAASLGSPSTATLTITDDDAGSTIQFGAAAVSVGEGDGKVTVFVTRSGDTSVPATVDYATTPDASVQPCSAVTGQASERCDYETATGTLRFAAGEAAKSFNVYIIDDARAEGPETFTVTLSNVTGTNYGVGSAATVTVTINDNETVTASTNPIDNTNFFVRQQYLDFLNREPDPGGFTDWVNTINNCPSGNTSCDRVSVSQNFFLSAEYQSRGYFAIRFYRAAFNRNPTFREFIGDLSRLSGQTTAETNALNAQFPADFVQRPEFVAAYGSLTNAQYVDKLIANTGVSFTTAQRDQFVADLNSATKTRAQVLRNIVEASQFASDQQTFNRAFVLTEYFGYLRRDPDTGGFNAWVATLNANPSNARSMVSGFVNSVEYRLRFGNP